MKGGTSKIVFTVLVTTAMPVSLLKFSARCAVYFSQYMCLIAASGASISSAVSASEAMQATSSTTGHKSTGTTVSDDGRLMLGIWALLSLAILVAILG